MNLQKPARGAAPVDRVEEHLHAEEVGDVADARGHLEKHGEQISSRRSSTYRTRVDTTYILSSV